jgi:hypothetical protein
MKEKLSLVQIGDMVAIYSPTSLLSYLKGNLFEQGELLINVGFEVEYLNGIHSPIKECRQFPMIDIGPNKMLRAPQSYEEFQTLWEESREDYKRERIKNLWTELNQLMND